MTVKEALAEAYGQLEAGKVSSSRIDAQLLLAYVLEKDRAWLVAHDNESLDQEDLDAFSSLVAKRSKHTPVVHLTGKREFYGLEFEITPDVLTPRVETEQMVEWAIKYAPQNSKLIDIGTGSGAIALAIKKHRPDLEVWATDVSDKELNVAKRNAKKLKLNIKLIQSDLFASIQDSFSTVVTNLPYLRDDADLMPEVQKEPAVALFGGEDGLELYRKFLQQLPSHLEKNGYLFTECDTWQQADLIKAAGKINLKLIEEDRFILGFQLASSDHQE
jgi:release factor glutamine methyltransferase